METTHSEHCCIDHSTRVDNEWHARDNGPKRLESSRLIQRHEFEVGVAVGVRVSAGEGVGVAVGVGVGVRAAVGMEVGVGVAKSRSHTLQLTALSLAMMTAQCLFGVAT